MFSSKKIFFNNKIEEYPIAFAGGFDIALPLSQIHAYGQIKPSDIRPPNLITSDSFPIDTHFLDYYNNLNQRIVLWFYATNDISIINWISIRNHFDKFKEVGFRVLLIGGQNESEFLEFNNNLYEMSSLYDNVKFTLSYEPLVKGTGQVQPPKDIYLLYNQIMSYEWPARYTKTINKNWIKSSNTISKPSYDDIWFQGYFASELSLSNDGRFLAIGSKEERTKMPIFVSQDMSLISTPTNIYGRKPSISGSGDKLAIIKNNEEHICSGSCSWSWDFQTGLWIPTWANCEQDCVCPDPGSVLGNVSISCQTERESVALYKVPQINGLPPFDWEKIGSDITFNKVLDMSLSNEGFTLIVSHYIEWDPNFSDHPNASVNVYQLNNSTEQWETKGPAFLGLNASEVRISSDGNRIAISSAQDSKVYIYDWNGTSWNILGNVIDSNVNSIDFSKDGLTIAIGNPSGFGVDLEGELKVYRFNNGTWQQLGEPMTGIQKYRWNGVDIIRKKPLGYNVKISGDGNTVASYIREATNFFLYESTQDPYDGVFRSVGGFDVYHLNDSNQWVKKASAPKIKGGGLLNIGTIEIPDGMMDPGIIVGENHDNWPPGLGSAIAMNSDGSELFVGSSEFGGLVQKWTIEIN